MLSMIPCFNPPTYKSFHVKFEILIPEDIDIVELWWKFNLHVQLAFDELVLNLKERFPLKDKISLEIQQDDMVLKLPSIKTKDMTGNWLMEAVENELGDFLILNVKKPFKIQGLSCQI